MLPAVSDALVQAVQMMAAKIPVAAKQCVHGMLEVSVPAEIMAATRQCVHGMLEVSVSAVFTASSFEGEPQETEEMAPQWFPISRLPYDQMWEDDPLWYPLLLQGKYFTGQFSFRDTKMLKHTLTEVDKKLLPGMLL